MNCYTETLKNGWKGVSLMDEKNESVIIYQTWLESSALLGEEKQIRALMQIIHYGIYGKVPENPDDPMMQMLLMNWMPLVDAQKKKRKGGAPKGNQNAKGHGAPKGNKNAQKTNNKNKQPFNVKGNGNGNVNANDNDPSLCLCPDGQASEGEQSPEEWEAMIDAL